MATIKVPQQATYGRPAGTQEDPGGMGGANKARDEWWAGQQNNNRDQRSLEEALPYASGEAARDRGPQAIENQGLSNNEASGAGGHQAGAIGLANTLARGQQPSQAAMQLQAGLNQSSDMQTSMGRSARGGAALAVGEQNAQNNIGGLQQNAWKQGGLLRSQDMAAGRGMLGTALGQQQAQDQQRIGQANQLNSTQNDAYRRGMGNVGVARGDVANQQAGQDQAWYSGGMQPIEAQSEADQQRQRWLADAQKQKIAANEEDT